MPSDMRTSLALLLTCFVLAKSIPLQPRGATRESGGFLAHFLSQAGGLAGSDTLGTPPKGNGARHASSIVPDGDDGKHKRNKKDDKDDNGGSDDRDEDDEDPYYGSAVYCRMVLFRSALNSTQCSEVQIKDDDSDGSSNEDETKGVCRWDVSLGERQRSGCLCPMMEKDCKKRKECHWRVITDDVHTDDDDGHCIHNSERFYNILARLLAKRGKKDLSLKIRYSSAPAKGNLPFGPLGPAVFGEASDSRFGPNFGMPGGFPSPYGYGPDPYGIQQHPFGHGLDPYQGQPPQYVPQDAAYPPPAGNLPVKPVSQQYLPPQQVPQYLDPNDGAYPATYGGNFPQDLPSQQFFPSQQAPLPNDFQPPPAPEAYSQAYEGMVPTPEACALYCSQQPVAAQYPRPQDYQQPTAGVLPGYN